MRIKRLNLIAGCAGIVIASMGIAGNARGQIVVNGTYDPAFGAPLAVAQVPTSAGDSTTVASNNGYADGSELDATYGTIQNNTLYLLFTGNLSSANQDNLDIFIQTGTGGINTLTTNTLTGGASPGSYNRLTGTSTGANRGLEFDSGFAPNYFITAGAPGGISTDTYNGDFNSYMNYANLNTGASGYLGYGNPGVPGTYNTNQVGNALGLSYGFNNSNTGGVTGTTVGNPASVTTGFEFAIPLADITEAGQTISTVEVTAFLADQHQDNIYNQLTGLAPGYDGANANNTNSLGDPTYAGGTNFNNDTPGPHFVTIANIPGSAWKLTGSGDWNIASDWANGVIPNGTTAIANFLGTITAPHTVYSDLPVTVASIDFNNSNSYVIAGAGSLTLQAASGSAEIEVDKGSHIIQLPTTFASNTTLSVAPGSTLNLTNAVTIDSGVAVTQTGGGAVNYSNVVTLQSGASVAFGENTTANTLNVANTAVATVGGSGSVLTLNNLGISSGGTLNIGKNELVVNYGSGADPIASIAALIKSGFNGGAWTGAGITSSAAQTTSGSYGIGYADAADPGNPAGLPAGEIEVVYTLLGDSNLDGAVNGTDFAIMASNFNKADQAGHSGWTEGDFNYDGSVNGSDFTELAMNFNKGTTLPADAAALDSFAAANGFLADVPEPASLGLLALAGVSMLSRRKRPV